MRKRKSMPMKKSKKLFRKTASKTNVRNVRSKPMRGGIRM